MNAVSHPIRLQNVVFTRSIVIAIQDFQEEGSIDVELGPTNNLNVFAMEGQPGYYQAIMQSVLNPNAENTSRYLIDMECIGIFHVEESLPPEEAFRWVHITAHSVLYGAIREAVAWLTGRQPYGSILLGLSVLQSKPAEEQKTATTSEQPSSVASVSAPR